MCACADDFVLSKPEFVVDVKSDFIVSYSYFHEIILKGWVGSTSMVRLYFKFHSKWLLIVLCGVWGTLLTGPVLCNVILS